VWLATVCNMALWQELQQLDFLTSASDYGFAAAMGLLITCLILVLLSLLCWPGTATLVVAMLLFTAAFSAYFMLTYHIVIDSTMIVNVLQTDLREATDLFSFKLAGIVLVMAILPLLVVVRSKALRAGWAVSWRQNAVLFLGACVTGAVVLLLSYQSLASLMRNHTHVRFLINPLNAVWAVGSVATDPMVSPPKTLQAVGLDARLVSAVDPKAKPPLLILVLGETARASNFAINGYGRPTTPHLSELKKRGEISSFQTVWSCGTSTATSLPCMFSPWGKEKFEERSGPTENLLDVLQRAGLAVLWLDNQSGCKGVCDRIPNEETTRSKDPQLCTQDECLDEIMLKGLDGKIAALGRERWSKGVVIVMHQMGSHGPAYYKRSPAFAKKFQPECTTNILQDCDRQQVVNAYDNSIVYTDHLLAQVIEWQKMRQNDMAMAMIYMSDHGESLGERNLYLHGLPYAIAPDVQKRVPWVTWLSPQIQQQRGIGQTCLNQLPDRSLSHDNLFHSVLGLLNVQTQLYRPGLDAYSRCVKP
jgi:lipid A ethanolaminephosphotransferase